MTERGGELKLSDVETTMSGLDINSNQWQGICRHRPLSDGLHILLTCYKKELGACGKVLSSQTRNKTRCT